MRPIGTVILVCGTVIAGHGVAQTPQTVSSDAKAAMASEWRSLILYNDLDLTTYKTRATKATGATHCLHALDLYTRAGASSPESNAKHALEELTLGNPMAEQIYKEAQALGLETGDPRKLPGLLAAAVPISIASISNNDTSVAFSLFDEAKTAINNAFNKDRVSLDRDVNQPSLNNPLRALLGLLNTRAADLDQYAAAVGALATATAKNSAAQADRQTKQAAFDPKKSAADNAQREATAADSARDAARTAKSDADGSVSADVTALEAARTALKEAKAKASRTADDVRRRNEAVSAASDKLKGDQAKAKLASVRLRKAEAEAQTATSKLQSALADEKPLTDALDKAIAEETAAAASQSTAQTAETAAEADAKMAIALMEVYRLCYSLDSGKLFKIVQAYFK